MFRVGLGYDINKLVEGRPLIIGGIEIPYEKGLLGHSDADVLIHAIIDAMLGALALSDIGTHFPDTDPKYKGISSVELLKNVIGLIHEKGYVINNIDSNIILQEPKMKPHIPNMVKNLSKIMGIDASQLSIKAKTNEQMDAVGEKFAIEASAVVMLRKDN